LKILAQQDDVHSKHSIVPCVLTTTTITTVTAANIGNEESALMMSLLGAFEGYEVAQFNAAWLLIRRGAGKHFSISRR
jgi:hypothetical protein